MPRNRPVDYPQVHPPTAQAYLGLAPPPNVFNDQPRFSWQDSSTEAVSPSHAAEKELEAGISGRGQEHRQSSIPPLPVLPDHLNGTESQGPEYQSSVREKGEYSSQEDLHFTSESQTGIAQQCYQQQRPQQQGKQFRPDIPRNIQHQESQTLPQQQTYHNPQLSGPPLSYEASQAQIISQQSHYTQPRMQEQPVYPGHHDPSSSQLTTHALPIHDGRQATVVNHQRFGSEDEGGFVQISGLSQANNVQYPTRATLQENSRAQTSRPIPIHIGPDANPLTPTSPASPNRHPNFPSQKSKNFQNTATTIGDSYNDPSPPVPFPQATSYTAPGPTRGGTWHNSLFSCSNPTICLPSLFCPCIIYGRTQHRLSQKSAKKDATNMLGYSAVNGSCIAWSVLCGVNILLTAIQHTRVRKMYEMEEGSGNVSADCVRSACCCCCVLAQDEKEVKGREEGGRREGMTERGYTSPGAMMYSPPPR